jgi:ABC-type Fe3+-siderophore transport system permease subunit
VAASRLLGAAAACVILLSFAAEQRNSYWNGCIQAAIVICQQIFALLALLIFLFKNPFKKCFQIVFWLQESFSFDLYTDSILKQLNKLKL